MLYKKICFIIILSLIPVFFLFSQDIYWEDPEILIDSAVKFYDVQSNSDQVVILWQEFADRSSGGGDIYLSIRISKDASSWQEKRRFLGPFQYTDKKSKIYSQALDREGRIYIAVSDAEKSITLFMSDDLGRSFRSTTIETSVPVISPRIFIKADNELLIFVTHESKASLAIYYTITDNSLFSRDKIKIDFTPLVTESYLILNFLPYHLSYNGKEYVVFQSRLAGQEGGNYQLYLKISADGGETWSEAAIITDLDEKIDKVETIAKDFSNQRPFLNIIDGELAVLWERRYTGRNPQVYYASLDPDGRLIGYKKITENNAQCLNPQIFSYRGTIYILWFDNSRGVDHIFLATASQGDFAWDADDLTYSIGGDSRFASPFILDNDLYIVWENNYKNNSLLYILEPDHTVNKPFVKPVNFKDGGIDNKDQITVSWNVPADPSGVMGFRYSWNQEAAYETTGMKEVLKDITRLNLPTDNDGTWYFRILAGDYAGNWSEPVTITYQRDTKPPAMILFDDLPLDAEGCLQSNTFRISWTPNENDRDLAGYAYTWQRISADINHTLTSSDWKKIKTPRANVQTIAPSRIFDNQENGLWAMAVIPIDNVGNTGDVNTQFFKLNKFKPETKIAKLAVEQDDFGLASIVIRGRGFTAEGLIHTIFLDRDGRAPYDYQFTLKDKKYRIVNDRLIDRLSFTDIEGEFRLGVIHDSRGIKLAEQRVKLDPVGTIKILPPLTFEKINYEKAVQPVFLVTINELVVWLLVVLIGFVLLASLVKIAVVIREGRKLETEVLAILRGPGDKYWRKEKMKRIKLKGAGLRLKFTLLMSILVILILAMISIPLSFYMIQTQRNDLTRGLENQVKVMLGSLVSSAGEYLSVQDELELGLLPENSRVMEEVVAATITGIRKKESEIPTLEEYIWGTNDPEIGTKLKDPEKDYTQGESILVDGISGQVRELAAEIDLQATEEVSALKDEITAIGEEISRAAGIDNAKYTELSAAFKEKNRIIEEKLKTIGNLIRSEPDFKAGDLKPLYTFYQPVVYRYRSQDVYFRGLIRLIVSTEKIQETITKSSRALLAQIGLFALIALGMGILVAIFLASIIIQPITKLVTGVAYIRDTPDKSKLKEHFIEIKQRDEIRMLADTINQMTQGLVKAAIASKDLTVGKETQKMFIPLQKDESGNKGTTGEESDDYVDIFGYYEGAKGVSGDYFDFKKLDNKHYCVIKCDVAGKGVPAALIMVEVATIFIDHFRTWNPKKPNLEITQLVYRINDLIEERGFKGRFAALTIGIINVQTGVGYFCNAGDKDIHIYNDRKKQLEMHKMPEAAATGVFPSDLLEMKAGFQQVTYKLQSRDAFFLWTDGLDEAKRSFRDADFKVIACNEPGLKEGADHGGSHNQGMTEEELTVRRLYEVVNSVFGKRRYELKKYHNPAPGKPLTFDFTRCKGNVKEAVLAMISVEKIFRMYKDPAVDSHDRVIVDKKIDAFLQEHFEQYSDYFIYREELPDNPGYVAFSHLKEDEQYDDLTLIAIQKK